MSEYSRPLVARQEATDSGTGLLSLPTEILRLVFTDATNVVALSFVDIDEERWPFAKTNYIPHALLKERSKLRALLQSDTNDLTFPNVDGPCQRATIVIIDDHRTEESRIRVTVDLGTVQGPADRTLDPPASPPGAKSYETTLPFGWDPTASEADETDGPEAVDDNDTLRPVHVAQTVYRLVNDLRCKSKSLDRDFPPLDRMKITHHLNIVCSAVE